jgi:dihydroxyacid dehydratase/phosphogluconate dehydratase
LQIAGFGKDVMPITDGRFSGGTTGPCVGHVAPEAADGGSIALVHDGDKILLDVANGLLDIDVAPEELERRRQSWNPDAEASRAWCVGEVREAGQGGQRLCHMQLNPRRRTQGRLPEGRPVEDRGVGRLAAC